MTSVRGSRPFSHNPDGLRGSQEREALFEQEDLHRQMNEPYFCDHQLFLDRQFGVEGTARSAEHGDRVGGEYLQELAAGDDDAARSAGVRRSGSGTVCTTSGVYDQGPIVGGLPAGTVVQVRYCNDPCLLIQISIRATAMKGPCVND